MYKELLWKLNISFSCQKHKSRGTTGRELEEISIVWYGRETNNGSVNAWEKDIKYNSIIYWLPFYLQQRRALQEENIKQWAVSKPTSRNKEAQGGSSPVFWATAPQIWRRNGNYCCFPRSSSQLHEL